MWLNISWRLFFLDLEVDNFPRSCSVFWHSVRKVCFLGHSNNVKALELELLAAVWPMWLGMQKEQINLLGSWWWVMKFIKGPTSGPWHGRWMAFHPDYDPLYPLKAEPLRTADESVYSPCYEEMLKKKRVERWPKEIGWKKNTKF